MLILREYKKKFYKDGPEFLFLREYKKAFRDICF